MLILPLTSKRSNRGLLQLEVYNQNNKNKQFEILNQNQN